MTRCDPRILTVLHECARGRRPTNIYMAQVAMALGLISKARNDHLLVPTALGTEVMCAMYRW